MNMGIKKSTAFQKTPLPNAEDQSIAQNVSQKAQQAPSSTNVQQKGPTFDAGQLPPDLSKVLDNKAPMLNTQKPATKGFNPLSMQMIDVDTAKGPSLKGRTFGFMADLAIHSGKSKTLDGAPVKNPNDFPNFSLTPPGLMDMDKQVFVIDEQLLIRQSGMGPQGVQSTWTDCGPVLSDAELKKACAEIASNATSGKTVDGPGVENPNDFPHVDITPDGLMGSSTSLYAIHDRLFTQQTGMGAEGKYVTNWKDIGSIPTTQAPAKSNVDLVNDAIKSSSWKDLSGSPVPNPNDFPSFDLTPPGLMGMSKTGFLIKGDLVMRQSGMGPDGVFSKWTSHGPAPKELTANLTQVLLDALEQASLVALDAPPKSNMNDFPSFTLTPFDAMMDMSKEAYLVDDKLFIAQSGMMAGGQVGTRWFDAGDAPKL